MITTLTKDQIQFIENYLENSDILYADIRMEMTDHVASAIEAEINAGDERNFYYIFKDYMITHKSKLLENNKTFIRNTDINILKILGRQIIRPFSVILFVLVSVLIYQVLNTVEPAELKSLIAMFPVLSIVPFCVIYFIMIKRYKLSRFSGIERLGFVYILVFEMYNFLMMMLGIQVKESANYLMVALSLALVFTVSMVMIQLTVTIMNQYLKEYKHAS